MKEPCLEGVILTKRPYFQLHPDVLPLAGKLVEVFCCRFNLTAVAPVEQQPVRGFEAEPAGWMRQRKTLAPSSSAAGVKLSKLKVHMKTFLTSLYSQETPGKGSWLHSLGWRIALPPINHGGYGPNPTTKTHWLTQTHTYINLEDYTQEHAHLPDLYVDEDALNVLTRQKPFKRFPKVLQK